MNLFKKIRIKSILKTEKTFLISYLRVQYELALVVCSRLLY